MVPRRNGPDVWRMWTRHSWARLSLATPENAHLGHHTGTGKWSRTPSRGPGATPGPSVGRHLSKGGANYLVRSHFSFTQPIRPITGRPSAQVYKYEQASTFNGGSVGSDPFPSGQTWNCNSCLFGLEDCGAKWHLERHYSWLLLLLQNKSENTHLLKRFWCVSDENNGGH